MLAASSLALLSVLQNYTADLSHTVWRNPSNSVHIRFEACGAQLCGTVVWASEKAIADTRRRSDRPLVGTSIFRNFHKVRADRWKGKVFVPDIGQTFSGTITVQGDRMVGKGCLIAGIGCKSQTWSRVAE